MENGSGGTGRGEGRIPVVFIAGVLTADGEGGVEAAIETAAQSALVVWKKGAVAVCPHLNSGVFLGKLPEGPVRAGYQELVRRCDIVWALTGWERSPGARDEVRAAAKAGIPIVESRGELERALTGVLRRV